MIHATTEPLPEGRQTSLRAWLGKPEFNTLCDVIEAQGKLHAANMVSKAVESKDYELKLDAANAELKAAQKYAVAIEVLKEISQQKEPFKIVKLT